MRSRRPTDFRWWTFGRNGADPCRIVGPVVDDLAREYAGRVKIGKLDVDANPQTAFRFNVRSIPSILFFRGGEVVDTVVGAHPKASLESKILEHV